MSKRTRKTKNNSSIFSSPPDYFFVLLILSVTIFGVIMVANSSVVEAYRDFGDKFYYFRLQLKWAAIGLGAFGLASLMDYHWLRKMATPLLILCLFFLVIVLIPQFGTKSLGARRWLELGPIGFQPSEVAKLALIIYLAAFLSRHHQVWKCLVLLVILLGLVMLQPDLGTTIVLAATAGVVYFVSGAPLWQMLALLLGGGGGAAALIFSSDYRRQRLQTFFDPASDPLGASYHIRQALIALGSGGLFGVGLGQSRQKYEYLPEVSTDSIFAVIAEEIGFMGSLVVLSFFLLILWRGLKIARQSPDDFGRLLAAGVTSWLGIQAFVNLSAMVALVPLTGIPLPFISYGGSSLVLALFAAGVLVNISRASLSKK